MVKLIKKALDSGNIYTIIKVSKSGMSRRVRFFIPYKNQIIEITKELELISHSLKSVKPKDLNFDDVWYPCDFKGTLLKGCGMDIVGYHLFKIHKRFNKNARFNSKYKIL